jgi:hypothetical protein
MDRVAGVIEVSLTDETHEVLISHPASQPNIGGTHEIAIMPRYARHLAHLLIEYADAAEAETRGTEPSPAPEKRPRFVLMGFRTIRKTQARSRR